MTQISGQPLTFGWGRKNRNFSSHLYLYFVLRQLTHNRLSGNSEFTFFDDNSTITKFISKKSIFRTLLVATVLVAVGAIASVNAGAAGSNFPVKFSLALIGDMPYDAKGQAQTPAVIDEINASKVAFTPNTAAFYV